MELSAVRQINGDLRIDDAQEDAPLLTIQFFAEFASGFTNEDKDQVLEVVVDKLMELLAERNE
jgi:hypothetical protein